MANGNGYLVDENGNKFYPIACKLYMKEDGYGDKFAVVPYFSGAGDSNLLKIQGAIGAAETDPSLYDLMTISGKSGKVWTKGGIEVGTADLYMGNGQYGIKLHNSDIIGLNRLVFNDTCEESEGVFFLKSGKTTGSNEWTDYDVLRVLNGIPIINESHIKKLNYAYGEYRRVTVGVTQTHKGMEFPINLSDTSIGGTGLTISGRNIVIGSGITKVKISAAIEGLTGVANISKGGVLMIGDEEYIFSYDKAASNVWHCTSSCSIVRSVTSGTKIRLGAFSSSTDNFECLSASLLVEDYS